MMPSSPENDPAYFGFNDLHGFRDFVVEVIAGAPDDFMEMDWLRPEDQINLDRAFVGLRYGLELVAKEVGESETIDKCRKLVEEAFSEYQAGRDRTGQQKLEEVERLLKSLPSQ